MSTWEKEYSSPILDAESQPFWLKAREGVFQIKHCQNCDKPHWYPRTRCPFCMSDKTEWINTQGRGTIYSYSVMRRARKPYIVAFVTLQEGTTVLTNLVECTPDQVRIGLPVTATYRNVVSDTGESGAIPVFKPIINEQETSHG